jgi:1-hydroxycarotenoid 3,4-desaturase
LAINSRIVVIGAGVGGLAAALELAARGLEVIVIEKAAAPGGKMRRIAVAGASLDAGPTVLTMRWAFEELFASAGERLDAHLTLTPLEILARHAWSESERLDLFASVSRTQEAIGALAGAAEARRYGQFCLESRRIYDALEKPFMRSSRTTPVGLVGRAGIKGLSGLSRINPFTTMWTRLTRHFADPRLRQLFGRYATYCGSSPFLAPATLMLVAHVEREGVWSVEGGMHKIASALADLAARRGAAFRYGREVDEILLEGGAVAGVRLADGERIDACAVVVNADVNAVAEGRFGGALKPAVAATPPKARSLSALTWAMNTTVKGFPLTRHNVFFSSDYAAEFDDIFRCGKLPSDPTIYVCAQDRGDREDSFAAGPERLLFLVNAPPSGDSRAFTQMEIELCAQRAFGLLKRCGLVVRRESETSVITAPADFERLFPATGGALYGRASHGWRASFQRPGARTRIPGLYLAGGSTHPGPGVPMAALSGRLAAASVLADRASTRRFHPAAMPGGTSTP